MPLSDVLDRGPVYTLWQAPFIRSKLRPVMNCSDFESCRRVLDLGCGPGVNTRFFRHARYTGLDWNSDYIQYARQKYSRDDSGREFIAADARTWQPQEGGEFDLVLANSFFHHIDDDSTDQILRRVSRSLSAGGHVHILDLVLPERSGIGRWLAERDRGDFPRPLSHWEELFGRHFESLTFEPFTIRMMGVGLWNMVHFRGQPKSSGEHQ